MLTPKALIAVGLLLVLVSTVDASSPLISSKDSNYDLSPSCVHFTDDFFSRIPSIDAAFDFKSFFTGEWQVVRSVTADTNTKIKVHDVVTVYVMNATNDRPADLTPLTGYSYENDTTTQSLSTSKPVKIEFETRGKGRFLTGPDDLSLSPLFDFDFVSLTSTSGVSRGPYLGGSSSSPKSYIFEASSPTRFTLTVTTPGATPEALPTAITFYGFKKVVVIEKTFLQMYGPFALAAILIAVNFYVQRRARQAAVHAAPLQYPPAASAASAKKRN